MLRKPLGNRYSKLSIKASFYFALTIFIFITLLTGCSDNKNTIKTDNKGSDLERGEAFLQQSQSDSALLYFRQVADSALKQHNWDKWFRGISGMIDSYRLIGNFEEAYQIADQALNTAKNRFDTTGTIYAGLLHKKALVLTDRRQFSASCQLLRQSIEIRSKQTLKWDTAVGLSYNILGNDYLFQGEYNDALGSYLKALSFFDNNKYSVDLATINQNAGIVYALKGDYDNAKKYFHKALTINQAVISADDPKLALVYLNYGRYYSLIGNDREALNMYDKAEYIYKNTTSDSKKNLAPLYHNIGNIYANSADYDKALLYFNKALSLYQSMPGESEQNIPAILSNIGYVYEKKGNYQQALSNYLQSVEKGKKTLNNVTIYRNLANIYHITNHSDDAQIYYELALDESLASFGEQNPETAFTFLKFGEFLSLTNRNREALTDLSKGLTIYRNLFGNKNLDVANALKYIGNFYARNYDFSKALNYFQQSLIAGFANFNSDRIVDNPEISKSEMNYFMLNSLNGKAFALKNIFSKNKERIDYLEASAAAYDASIKMIELLRSSYQNEESKLLIAGNEKSTFRNAIQVSVELYDNTHSRKYLEKALELSEKGRSAVLLSNIRDLEAKEVGEIPSKLRDQETGLKESIGLYEKLVYDEKASPKANSEKLNLWNNKLFELNKEYDSLVAVFEKEYPEYFKMKYDNSVMGLKEIQDKLTEDQTVIEYIINDTTLMYRFVISKSRVDLTSVSLSRQFFSDITTLSEQMSGKSFNNYNREDFDQFVNASARLYKILIPENLSHKLPGELIIIPDGELGYLSFDVLLTEQPKADEMGYRSLPYLIKKSALNYAPSATMMFGEFGNKQPNNHDVVAFAPTYDNMKEIPVNTILNRQSSQSYLMPIPGAQIEVSNLRRIFKCKILKDQKATKDNFLKYAGNFSILHLAMHTLIDDENPLYSKLVFYRDKAADEANLLNTYELFNMKLNAQLAVLSACNTGKGKLIGGEGILSLSRGFFYAGVPSVIMTLWAVEDRSGADLMTSFYKYLSDGKAKNEALRLAKMDYLKSSDQMRAHPHFWAAYMSIGNTNPIKDIDKPVTVVYYIIGITVVCILIIILFIAIKRRRAKA
jgi:CHAT domain-containing protein/tetratricopeptide (TPR) repeat protein